VITEEPEFTETIENVTVPAGKSYNLFIANGSITFCVSMFLGRNVKLACSVKNLGSYKVRRISIENQF
jgi:hypothetical protein